MKKQALAGLLAAILLLCACGAQETQPDEAAPTAVPVTAVPETAAPEPTPEPAPEPEPSPDPEDEKAAAYEEAERMLAEGDTAHAAMAFYALSGYSDAAQRSRELWAQVAPYHSLAVGERHTVALKEDGSLWIAGQNDFYQCDVPPWEDLVSISAFNHTVGLRSDGTVAAVGKNNFHQCDVDDWTDIVAVSAGGDNTLGLRADGTVVASGCNDSGQCAVDDWTDVIAVSAGNHSVALRADGTALAVGDNSLGQCEVDDWTDLVAVLSAGRYTFGLKRDGTVLQAGFDGPGCIDVSGWTDITALSYGSFAFLVGVRRDGTLVFTSERFENKYGQLNLHGWTNVVDVGTGAGHTVCLMADGTLKAVGHNGFLQCMVDDWTDIRMSNYPQA